MLSVMGAKKKAKKKKAQLRLRGISGKIKPTAQDFLIAKKIIVDGKKKGEALVEAGFSPGTVRGNSGEILRKPGVRAAMAIVMIEAGIDEELIARKLNEGMNATKIISANLLMLGDSGKPDDVIDATAIAGAEREKAFIRVEDFQVRHKYLETSCKLLDLFPRDGSPAGGGMDPGEEQNLIAKAEADAAKRNYERYQERHE